MRLCNTTLANLPATVQRPAYDRAAVTPGIVHLGLGAFTRAHMAVYTDDALAAGARDWGMLGASLRSPETRDALAPQDGLYVLALRDADGERLRVIGSITGLLAAPERPEALIAAMAAPSTRIVSLTITEKGYCHDPATGALNEAHPDVLHDLAHPDAPRSAIGFMVAALARRRAAGIAPFTVLSCDNLPANGHTTRRVLTRFAHLVSPGLGKHLEAGVACPSTMVDRIVPATTGDDRACMAAALGVTDAWPVVTEPFSQWVIEDHFPLGRPDWGAHGAELVRDVAPYETMKLRLLNGAHSAIAYLGGLAGFATVADAMAEPSLAAFIERLMRREVIPVLTPPPGADPQAYASALLARFRNPALRHRTAQIAMDGSQKLPQRLLATARERLARGLELPCIALAVAAWMRHVAVSADLRDPMADELRRRAASGQPAAALLGIEAIFGRDLPADARFVLAVTNALAGLGRDGALATLRQLTEIERTSTSRQGPGGAKR